MAIKVKSVDLSHPPLADGQIAIQRLPIHLPGYTTVIKFEPKYTYPLYKMLWKFRDPKAPIHDSEDMVRILDAYPSGCSWKNAWLVIDEDMAMESEANRLLAQFGFHPNGERLFDVVYPGDAFERAFLTALKPTLALTAVSVANPTIAEFATLDGVGMGMAEKLYAKNFRSLRDIALAQEDELAKVIGKTRAVKAKADAESRFETPASV